MYPLGAKNLSTMTGKGCVSPDVPPPEVPSPELALEVEPPVVPVPLLLLPVLELVPLLPSLLPLLPGAVDVSAAQPAPNGTAAKSTATAIL
jgi:hypothetical protein